MNASKAAAVPSWKKPAGTNLSAKAKKEYLKWKRERKRNQVEDDSDSDWVQGGPPGDELQRAATTTAIATAGEVKAGSGRAAGARLNTADAEKRQQPWAQQQRGYHQQQQHNQQQKQQPAGRRQGAAARTTEYPDASEETVTNGSDGDGDGDGDEDGEHRDSAAAPGGLGPAANRTNQGLPNGPGGGGGGGGGGGSRAVPDDKPLCYQPMVELPRGDVPESIRAVCGDDMDVMRLPRVREDEVGFTEEGRRLGMPKRPHWRGVVRNAEQLHRIEERSFQAWVKRMYDSVDSPSRISFFEPKLDFWRQLWRVLERSDVAIMIVDARNPLLHFSEALAHHVMDDHGIPALLALNKCDLVPASCVEQWRRFFERRYPGLKVVASSASAAGGREAAEAIMDAVLDCVVMRDGQRVKVSEVVQMTRDEILVASKSRNTHSKRNRPQPMNTAQRQQQEQKQQQVAVEASGAEGSGADPETGAESGMEGGGRDRNAAVGGWELKGNKAKKKEAVRRKRNQRMHGGAGGGSGGDGGGAAGAGTGTSTAAGERRLARGRKSDRAAAGRGAQAATWGPRGALATGSARDRATGAARETADADADADADAGREERHEDGQAVDVGEEGLTGEVEADGGSVLDDLEDADASVADDDNDNDNLAFDQLVADEDEACFLHDDGSSDGGEDEGADGGSGSRSGSVGGDAATGTPVWGGHGARGGRDRRGRSRPVVVCVVGEPNVGKSSTMNALLGAKRVAVSSHPGRTKHYQTHVMCSGLMLCDCPGLVFPRLDVSLYMQVLFGSYPIARCRDPYAVVRYLAERVWPRLHRTLGLRPVTDEREEEREEERGYDGLRPGKDAAGCGRGQRLSDQQEWRDADWTPLMLCEALAARHNWRSRRGGRLDVYRAANWILRSALAGRNAVNVGFLPPQHDAGGSGDAVER
ncbi:hypothetical protein Vafri_7319 [Volvox africanus]|uniref:Guanine nucleotide-binding protein-like 1 n=1 Tax=Volvox africanus TaxID=51714 RepID=A0A8J4F0F2_9CHLO|nr:hypothetical protein Vafri_7319 [Volvox africanus]